MTNAHDLNPELLDQSAPQEGLVLVYKPLKDKVYILGLVLLAISLGLYALSYAPSLERSTSGTFLVPFALVWVYTIALWINKRLRWWAFGSKEKDYPTTLLLLMLWLVSCFALNQEVEIFRPSSDWLSGYLLLAGAGCVAYGWKDQMSSMARTVLWAVLSASFLLFLYYALALLPVCLYGLIVVWVFGLPLHAYVPLVLCVYLATILIQAAQSGRRNRLAIIGGIALPLSVVIVFASAWYQVSNRLASQSANDEKSRLAELPRWVRISQRLETNWLNGYLLKAVAEGNMPTGRGIMGGFLSPAFGAKENDPVMQIAAAVSPKPDLSNEECRQIYAAQYNARNVMEERLWAGNDLLTTQVKSDVMLDPSHRLSYTEKTLTVAQRTLGNSRATTTQEAIYTFFLPNGGTVSALSLWIDGVESPGILTTRSKAQEAYKTIVGRERRDPALVLWQEGNQVSVRVFPVTPDAPRQFKIGVTAPLQLENQTLVYQNISFDGPSALTATEQDSVFFASNAVFADAPVFFKTKQANGATALTYHGLYHHRWSVVCQAPPLSHSVFSFDGKTYVAQTWKPQNEAFRPDTLYLDLNEAWTLHEFEQIRAWAKGRPVLVDGPEGLVALQEENAAQLFRQKKALRFSLFPFYKVNSPETGLVITKSAENTPLPSALEGTAFGEGLKKMQAQAPMRVFHLGAENELCAYLRAQRERRSIFCVSGQLETIQQHLSSNTFTKNPESPERVALPEAGLLIAQQDTALSGKAPDHLFRLFAYNKVLQDLHGRSEGEAPELALLAEQANVVTPITSLVTLESKADYERFDIQQTQGLKTLGNAGSVPEPHEWALLGLLLLAAWMAWKRPHL